MSKKIFKKTRNIYHKQHKTFFKNNDLFNRFYKYAVNPSNYCLDKKFFKGATVLDAGCGNTGYFTKAMIDLGCEKVICLDLGKKWISELKKGLKLKKVDISKVIFKSGSITKIPLKTNSVDFVACNGVLYHLPSLSAVSKAVKEFNRVVKTGGNVFAYFGVEKPGIIEKYIFPAIRIAYKKEKEFKNFVDYADINSIQKNLKSLIHIFHKNDKSVPIKNLKNFIKLFNNETIMFIQDCLQTPVYHLNKLNKKFVFSVFKKIGAKNIRIPEDHYFIRSDVRKFLTPLHVTKRKNLISRILYGEHLKFIFKKG